MSMTIDDRTEWLEPDGLGGFASGTTSGVRTRRYHALLLTATTPPTGRLVLVNGFDAWIDTSQRQFALSSQRYGPDVLHPDGASRIVQFVNDPWPTWEFATSDGTRVVQEIFVEHGTGTTVVVWTLTASAGPVQLHLRPFMSGRDYHSLHRENRGFRFDALQRGPSVEFRTYAGLPSIVFRSNGDYRHAPDWYRNFLYSAEHQRGLDDTEDLASPGSFGWSLNAAGQQALLMLKAGGDTPNEEPSRDDVVRLVARIRDAERQRRQAFDTPMDRAADGYLVRRGSGRTIVAGYPWFTDWGRDTFIALRGLCLASGRLTEARDILVEWAGAVSEGMLPNRFPDSGEAPEFNSVDASLWYVVVVGELLRLAKEQSGALAAGDRHALEAAVQNIVKGYAAGTRYGIRVDADGLLAAGVPGVQLTWMDARVGSHVITPRIGKPVEIQALWLNALLVASEWDSRWREVGDRGRRSFLERFWQEEAGFLADVVDVDHVPGTRDDSFRPNQILAVGGLPLALAQGMQARRVVDAVERRLLTPLGLRSLAPEESGYAARYEGDAAARDAVYHQGTVWPWLIGPFVEAWVRVRQNTPAVRREARRRFIDPLLAHLGEAGLGHVSEIADAEPPFTPRGCPFQAWSLGELLRANRLVRSEHGRVGRKKQTPSPSSPRGENPPPPGKSPHGSEVDGVNSP
jgi:predicted glycogen debranching enzyme